MSRKNGSKREQQTRSRKKAKKRRPLKRRRVRKSIGTQEVAKFIYPGTRHSEIRAGRKDLERALHQMSRELNSAQNSRDTALGRNREVVIREIPELFMKNGNQREGSEAACSKSVPNGTCCFQTDISPWRLTASQ